MDESALPALSERSLLTLPGPFPCFFHSASVAPSTTCCFCFAVFVDNTAGNVCKGQEGNSIICKDFFDDEDDECLNDLMSFFELFARLIEKQPKLTAQMFLERYQHRIDGCLKSPLRDDDRRPPSV
jgi:hypothetical protein